MKFSPESTVRHCAHFSVVGISESDLMRARHNAVRLSGFLCNFISNFSMSQVSVAYRYFVFVLSILIISPVKLAFCSMNMNNNTVSPLNTASLDRDVFMCLRRFI